MTSWHSSGTSPTGLLGGQNHCQDNVWCQAILRRMHFLIKPETQQALSMSALLIKISSSSSLLCPPIFQASWTSGETQHFPEGFFSQILRSCACNLAFSRLSWKGRSPDGRNGRKQSTKYQLAQAHWLYRSFYGNIFQLQVFFVKKRKNRPLHFYHRWSHLGCSFLV